MTAPKKTGEEMADAILAAPYDPNWLAGWFANVAANIADGRQTVSAKKYARQTLEALADHETFLAEHPLARRTR